MKILIAEDDPGSRLLLARTLENLGHEVVATEDGRQAWAAIQREHFPILILDWMMPGFDGPDLCRMIRKVSRDHYSYIIMLTARSGKANYLEAIRAGADDFLTKPFDQDLLAARLHVAERILGLRQHVQRLEGLLPICSYCKSIRDDEGNWQALEHYIGTRSEAQFTHGICPVCYETHVKPELEEWARQSRAGVEG